MILNYCQANTTPAHPVQQELMKETLATYKEARGMGAPACLALNAAFALLGLLLSHLDIVVDVV